MKKTRFIAVGLAIILILAGASFAAGIFYQRSASTASANSFQGPSGAFPGRSGGSAGTPRAAGAGFGGGSQGQIESIDGSTLTINTGQATVKVTISSSTSITKSTTGVLTDIKTGDRVQVVGQADANGNIIASQVTVLPQTGNSSVAVNPTSTP